MKYIIVIGVFALIIVQILSSHETDQYYTNLKENDTIVVYGYRQHDVHSYFFIDEISCFTCVQSVKNVLALIKKNTKYNVVFFIRASSKQSYENIVKLYNIDKEMAVHDIVGAYQKLYGIKQFPVMMMTNRDGIIQYIGIPGKTSFDSEKINVVLQKSTIPSLKSSIQPSIKQKIVVSSNNYPLKKDHIVTCTYSIKDDKLYLWKFNSHNLYVIQMNGKVEQSFSMDDDYSSLFSGTNVPVLGNGNIHGKNIPFSILNMSGHSTLMSFNTETKKFSEITVLHQDDYTYPFFPITVINDSIYVSALRYKEKGFPQTWNVTPSFRVIENGIAKKYGTLDEIVIQYPISRFYHQATATDTAGNIIELENFSEKVRIYNTRGELLYSIKCSFSPKYWNYKWKDYFSQLNVDSPVQSFMNLQDSVTKIAESDGILVDQSTGKLAVVYQKNAINSSNNRYVRYFVHFPASTLNDIALPNDAKPFRYHKGIIYCIESENEDLYITSYQTNQNKD